jgi:ubiquinone/menaquinone biosynthesis C-methylase UbiE
MSVAEHLGIKTSEYDAQILTFIPFYDEILDNAASALDALDRPARVMVDLGTGSGALAARCLKRLKDARVIGIDSDAGMLAMARRRLGRRLTTVVGNFETAPIPRCDVVTASFSLHHITTPAAKAKVFRKAYRALSPGGLLIDADCVTAVNSRLQRKDMAAWHAHLAPPTARPERPGSSAPGPVRIPTSRWTRRPRCSATRGLPWTCRGGAARWR